MPIQFAITYDYLCPFACIANDVVAQALRDGADWNVEFRPFSLAQTKVEDGEPTAWDRPVGADGTRGIQAHLWSLAVRAADPDRWLGFHSALFSARFSDARDVGDPDVLAGVAVAAGLDPVAIRSEVDSGSPTMELAASHTELVKRWSVFGVPTFIAGDEAVFVRLMERSRRDVEQVIGMLDWVNLNEFKRTTIPR